MLVPYIRSLTDRHIRMPGENEFGPGSPPEDFMRCTLKAVCPALGNGRTKSLGISLNDFIGAMTRAERSWAHPENDSWICRARKRAGKAGYVRDVFYVFEKMDAPSFVLISHIAYDGRSMTAQEVIFFGFLVSVTLYTARERAARRGRVPEEAEVTVLRGTLRGRAMDSRPHRLWGKISSCLRLRP
jgi:hypothetical protein